MSPGRVVGHGATTTGWIGIGQDAFASYPALGRAYPPTPAVTRH